MPAPDNAAELLPVSWQIAIAILTLATTIGGVAWKFFSGLKTPQSEHVVLERAELADMNPIREFIRDFRPALEKLSHIEQIGTHNSQLIQEALVKLNKMERDAEVAKGVREELAREKARNQWRHRDDRDE
jgi:hypothetical protein